MTHATISYQFRLCLVRRDTVWSTLLSVGLIGFRCATMLDGGSTHMGRPFSSIGGRQENMQESGSSRLRAFLSRKPERKTRWQSVIIS